MVRSIDWSCFELARLGYLIEMNPISLHDFHQASNGSFREVAGQEVVNDYGDWLEEHAALRNAVGILDLSFRGRLCLVGADRQRFLHGQVTNDVNRLKLGEGCYAALVTAKGKMVADLNIYVLENEILLDFEPGLCEMIAQRLEKYVIADDVQIVEVGDAYGLLSVQGPKADEMIEALGLEINIPDREFSFAGMSDPTFGEIYVINHPRAGQRGFDLFVPTNALRAIVEKLVVAASSRGGRLCGWQALETARIEAGIPRFGIDIDETNLPPEAGLDSRAISYSKGCYIGQEVIARVRTYGQVAKALRGLRLVDSLRCLPQKGDKLFARDKEVGFITSAVRSPVLQANIALAYVRRESNQVGATLLLRSDSVQSEATIVPLPFVDAS